MTILIFSGIFAFQTLANGGPESSLVRKLYTDLIENFLDVVHFHNTLSFSGVNCTLFNLHSLIKLRCIFILIDCWAEPEKRPGCQEILTRLLDCEHTLC
jgi:hypothetical protein